MPKIKRNGKQRENTAGTGFGNSKSSPKQISKFEDLLKDLRGKGISNSDLRSRVMDVLFDSVTENPEEGKFYFFEYDPKFRDILSQWDQYPLIQLLEKKGGQYLGANLHYISPKERLYALNNKRMPTPTLHYYIPKRADNLFFEVTESDAQLLSQLPLEKFHNRNRVTNGSK